MFLKMSLTGGTLILFISVIRFFALDKLPKRMFMLLWIVALLRLLLPVELPFSYGIASPVVKVPGVNISDSQEGMGSDNFNLTAVIWLTGAAAMFLYFGTLYAKERRKMQEALPVPKEREKRLRVLAGIPDVVKFCTSDRINSPLTFGIFKPKIILPGVLQPENDSHLKYVLIHELVHIRRADNLWKIVMFFALCIHWFNPLVWLMCVLFNRDMELACDEKVLLIIGEDARKEYAMTLVNLAEKQCRTSVLSIGFGKNAVKERIVAIMKFRKITMLGMACALVLTGVSITVFAEGKSASGDTVQYTPMESVRVSVNQAVARSEFFPEYEKFGLSYDADTDHLMYGGAVVGFFHDETSPNVYTHLTDEEGNVYLVVNRDASNVIVSIKPAAAPGGGDTVEEADGGT